MEGEGLDRICPFCNNIFGASDIKKHIAIAHLNISNNNFVKNECKSSEPEDDINLNIQIEFQISKSEESDEDKLSKTPTKKLQM